jgi:hypothetical protein
MDMGNSSSSLIDFQIKKLTFKFLIPFLAFVSILLSIPITVLFIKYKNQVKEKESIEIQINSLYDKLKINREKISSLEKELDVSKKNNFTLQQEDLLEVLKFVTENLEIKEDTLPKIRYITREELSKEILAELQKPKEEDIDTSRIFLQTFGFISKDKSNEQLMSDAIESRTNFPIAFYDPSKEELTFIKGLTSSKVYYKYVLSHELAHYIQSKKLELNTRNKELENGDTDKYYAFLAIVEGTAETIADKYVASLNQLEKLELKNATREASNVAQTQKISKFDQMWGEFVYLNGNKFVKEISKIRNPNYLLKEKEFTSEYIYNPQRYIQKDINIINESKINFDYNLPGYDLAEEDVFGQFGCNIIVFNYKDKNDEICTGWNGDKVKLFKKNGKFILIYASKWDSTKDLKEAQKGIENSFKDYGLIFDQTVRDSILINIVTNDSNINLKNEIQKIYIK